MDIARSGSRLAHWDTTTRVAMVCECGKRNVHLIEDLRHMPRSTSVDALPDILTAYCQRVNGECQAEFVSPDDGVAMEG